MVDALALEKRGPRSGSSRSRGATERTVDTEPFRRGSKVFVQEAKMLPSWECQTPRGPDLARDRGYKFNNLDGTIHGGQVAALRLVEYDFTIMKHLESIVERLLAKIVDTHRSRIQPEGFECLSNRSTLAKLNALYFSAFVLLFVLLSGAVPD